MAAHPTLPFASHNLSQDKAAELAVAAKDAAASKAADAAAAAQAAAAQAAAAAQDKAVQAAAAAQAKAADVAAGAKVRAQCGQCTALLFPACLRAQPRVLPGPCLHPQPFALRTPQPAAQDAAGDLAASAADAVKTAAARAAAAAATTTGDAVQAASTKLKAAAPEVAPAGKGQGEVAEGGGEEAVPQLAAQQ